MDSEISTMIIPSKEQEVIRMGMEHCNEEARDVYSAYFEAKGRAGRYVCTLMVGRGLSLL